MLFRPKPFRSLQRLLGQHKVLISEEDLLSYSYDTTALRVLPDMVVLAESAADVQAVVDFALDEGYIITPQRRGDGHVRRFGSVETRHRVVHRTHGYGS